MELTPRKTAEFAWLGKSNPADDRMSDVGKFIRTVRTQPRSACLRLKVEALWDIKVEAQGAVVDTTGGAHPQTRRHRPARRRASQKSPPTAQADNELNV